ncbi:hypothetical protein RSAG8_00474, partial [Rhizoctonia solani AG-8 WAC10335]
MILLSMILLRALPCCDPTQSHKASWLKLFRSILESGISRMLPCFSAKKPSSLLRDLYQVAVASVLLLGSRPNAARSSLNTWDLGERVGPFWYYQESGSITLCD